jgi:predicted permease
VGILPPSWTPAGLLARLRSLWRGLRRRDTVEAEIAEEFEHHIELRTKDLIRKEGLGPKEAYRRARLEFGHVEGHREDARVSRGLHWFDGLAFSWLDLKLGLRMLVRYPGLTLVAGVALAFVIAVSTSTFEFMRDIMYPTIPLPGGDRIVRLHKMDVRRGVPVGVSPGELGEWSEALQSVEQLGGFGRIERNLRLGDERPTPAEGIVVSPTAFEIAAVVPELGRPIIPGDAGSGSDAVVALGYEFWRSRFGADSDVVGRVIGVGDVRATVVGVMPRGFAFPEPAEFYLPLSLNDQAATAAWARVTRVTGFGRLAAGATREEAEAELSTVGTRGSASDTESEEQLRLVIRPFAYPLITFTGIWINVVFAMTAAFFLMLLAVTCANVALLLFARTATREGEISIRAALGAGRGRIVAQLFAEALVLTAVAATVGLILAEAGLKWVLALVDAFPFWVGDTLSIPTIAWAILLTLIGAAVAGLTPALQVTAGGLHARVQSGAARGAGLRLGRTWTVIVVSQVALTVLFLPVSITFGAYYWEVQTADRSFPAGEYLVAQLRAVGDPGDLDRARAELPIRLATESWARGVAVADGIWPVLRDDPVEVEGLPVSDDSVRNRRAQHLSAGPEFFDVLGAELVVGRPLSTSDVGQPVVVVNESFVRENLQGQNALGRRIRIGRPEPEILTGDPGALPPWQVIVGVVKDLGLNPHADLPMQGVIYHPLPAQGLSHMALTVHVDGTPPDYAQRLRVLVLEVGPTLRLETLRPLDHLMDQTTVEYGAWFGVFGAAGALAMLLTLAGIYAVLAFTVSRRTREIGVRVALGATKAQVARSVLSRTVRHVGYGVATGGILLPVFVLAMVRVANDPNAALPSGVTAVGFLAVYLVAVTTVCAMATIGPLRRALSISPREALTEGL